MRRQRIKASGVIPRRRLKRPVQQALVFPRRGGARKGAGRKPNGARAGVSHRARAPLASRFPVHVTLRVRPEVYNLRSRRSFSALQRAFFAGCARFGFRLCEFSVQGNHLHLLVEAKDATTLSRGMQGIAIRMARGLNKMMARAGKVFADRYHARILRTPTEVRHATRYVLHNYASHAKRAGKALGPAFRDPFCSIVVRGVTAPADTWLLQNAIAGVPRR